MITLKEESVSSLPQDCDFYQSHYKDKRIQIWALRCTASNLIFCKNFSADKESKTDHKNQD
jgi:hypothetical protein